MAKKGKASQHLENCLNYILNEEKNEDGRWVGGNCGTDAGECYRTMMDTKNTYAYQRSDKLSGRQGYHFLIALPPGEGDMETLMEVTREFCEAYLGENYDYVYSGHTDRPHKHTHIVFNSVSRTTGLKYHYANGDWAREIQPLVNQICRKYGLSTLEIGSPDLDAEKAEEKAPYQYSSYHDWQENQKGKYSPNEIMKRDIDRAIEGAGSYAEFLNLIGGQGYLVRQGKYLSLKLHKENRAVRSYQLGENYSVDAIKARIDAKKLVYPGRLKTAPIRMEERGLRQKDPWPVRGTVVRIQKFIFRNPGAVARSRMSPYQLAYAKRIMRARQAYQNRHENAHYHRKDYNELQELSRELVYMSRFNLRTEADVQEHLKKFDRSITEMREKRKDLYKKYKTERKSPDGLFLRYKAGSLAAGEMERVEPVYQTFTEECKKIRGALRDFYAGKRFVEKIENRLREERTEFLQDNQEISAKKKKDTRKLKGDEGAEWKNTKKSIR